MDRQTGRRTDGWTGHNRQIDGQRDGQTHRQRDEKTYRRTYGWSEYNHTDGQTYG